MKIAAIYDIHGNLPALEATLKEIEQITPDLILVGGDVATGPIPRATIERLMDLGEKAFFVRGNCDRDLVASFDKEPPAPHLSESAQETNTWCAQQLERRHRDFLASFADQAILSVDGLGDVLFCHGSPRSDLEIITAATPEDRLRTILNGVKQKAIVCGHTHMQFNRSIDGFHIMNAGSVGMPYGKTGAHWLLLGSEIEFRRTSYDLEQAASLVLTSGYPNAQDFAENNMLTTASEAEAIELFERLATQPPYAV